VEPAPQSRHQPYSLQQVNPPFLPAFLIEIPTKAKIAMSSCSNLAKIKLNKELKFFQKRKRNWHFI
jgi:hypothetical protein